MAEKMSLQQVRDWAAKTPANNGWKAKERDEAIAAIDAHLAQPAQAVDVGAIREVIASMRKESNGFDFVKRWHKKLTSAIGNAQADD